MLTRFKIMEKICLIILLIMKNTSGFCPNGCGCDDELLVTSCLYTDLEVMPISLNPGVKTLILKYNNFRTVDASISFYPSLVNLDISNNRLEFLHDRVFNAQAALKDLNLSDNLIKDLSKRTFAGLKNIQIINLRKNKIKNISEKVFKRLKLLESLDLGDNEIEDLNDNSFGNIKNIQTLKLDNNNLQFVPPKSLSAMINLVKLDLAGNNIAVISSFSLQSLSSLVSLNLARNSLKKIDANSFEKLNSLQILNLENNDLLNIPTAALSKATNLRNLSLGQNHFTEIPSNALMGNIYLTMVNISHCPHLLKIKQGTFTNNTLLEHVILSDNARLEILEEGIFPRNNSLKVLDISNNAFTSISSSLLNWTSLRSAQLSGNPWHCDCKINFFKDIIYSIVNNSEDNVKIVKCLTPDIFRGQDIVLLDTKSCDKVSSEIKFNKERSLWMDESSIVHITTIVFASLVILIVVLSSSLLLYFRCRRSSQCPSSETDTLDRTEESFHQTREHLCDRPSLGTNKVSDKYSDQDCKKIDTFSKEAFFHKDLLKERNGRFL